MVRARDFWVPAGQAARPCLAASIGGQVEGVLEGIALEGSTDQMINVLVPIGIDVTERDTVTLLEMTEPAG